jgi:hypothetical protein
MKGKPIGVLKDWSVRAVMSTPTELASRSCTRFSCHISGLCIAHPGNSDLHGKVISTSNIERIWQDNGIRYAETPNTVYVLLD